MPTNFYFQSGSTIGRTSEQRLHEDLIIESLKIYGFDVYYLPRALVKEDILFGEDVLSKFEFAIPLEMYLKNVNGYAGDGDFVRAFGIEIRDRATFVVARNRWEQTIQKRGLGILDNRPSEGDLIFLPISNSLFEIKFVEHENPFYQVGKLYVWELQCEQFVYASEKLNTSIPEIDSIVTLQSEETSLFRLLEEDGLTVLRTETSGALIFDDFKISTIIPGTDNDQIKIEDVAILDWTETNPFGDVRQ